MYILYIEGGGFVRIVIKNISSIPIYEQIKDQIIEAILNDKIEADEKLPSIRELARDLKVSVITTTRAYKELEDSGYIKTVQGVGCFVLPKNAEVKHEMLASKLEELLFEVIELQQEMNLSTKDILTLIDTLKETL